MSAHDATARVVDAAVRAVPGVVALYAASPTRALARRADAPLTHIGGRDALEVEVSIGVSDDERAADVADRVVSTIRETLDTAARVHVRVSRIVRQPASS